MFFHKTGIMKKIFVLLFSVTIITAGGSEEDKTATVTGAVRDVPNKDNANPEDSSSDAPNIDIPNPEDGLPDTEEGPPYHVSDGVSEEFFLAYPHCWKDMKSFCNSKKPQAVDFAKAALLQWKMGHVFGSRFLIEFYSKIAPHLDTENILAPNEFCAAIFGRKPEELPRNEEEGTVSGKTPSNEGEGINTGKLPKNKVENPDNIKKNADQEVRRCLTDLSVFGVTREAALRHAFYEKMKRGLERVPNPDFDIYLDEISQLSAINYRDFTDVYMNFMAKFVQVKPTMKRPLIFCKQLEERDFPHLYS